MKQQTELEILENYLKETCYQYTIHASFINHDCTHAVVTGYDPCGGESDYYILFTDGEHILNAENGCLVATLIDNKLEIHE